MANGDWVAIPGPILKKARKRKGLSYEVLARQIPVSSKTWERYEKQGRVPRELLERVTELLDIEIESPQFERVRISDPRGGVLEELLERVEAMQAEGREIRTLLLSLREETQQESPAEDQRP